MAVKPEDIKETQVAKIFKDFDSQKQEESSYSNKWL